ncbi:MAG: hypothetical protein ACLQGP_15785 [Isosphaeraceae bacterium]
MRIQRSQNEYRQLRDRQAAFDRRLDVATSRHPEAVTARRLVQIYNSGHMGSAPGLYYSAHPVQLNGIEQEGGTATPIVDLSTTLLVVVLNGTPVEGDILAAYAVGGRWVAEIKGTPPACSLCGCADAPLVVDIVDAVLGSATLNWQGTAGPSYSPTWVGVSRTYHYLGGGGCAAQTDLALTWTLMSGSNCSLSVAWNVTDPTTNCPTNDDTGYTASFTYNLTGSIGCDPLTASYLTTGIAPTDPYAILTGGTTASATATGSGSNELSGGTVCCKWPCGGSAPPILNITIACDAGTYGPFAMGIGGYEGCCLYSCSVLVNFPGTAVCPAVSNVPLTLTYNACSGIVSIAIGVAPGSFSCTFDGTYPPPICGPDNCCPGTNVSEGYAFLGQGTLGMGLTGVTCSPYSNIANLGYGEAIPLATNAWPLWTFFGGTCASGPVTGGGGLGSNLTVTVSEP